MMQIIKCKFCNGTSIPLNGVSVDVNLKKHTWCEHCRESKTEIQSHFFCSQMCFLDFIKQCDIKWTE